MAEVSAWEFLKALARENVALAPADPARDSLAGRPFRLFRRLERLGYMIQRTRPVAEAITSFGFAPRTVFDVGVDNGTAFLYRSFPDAHFVLIDPVAECEERIARWKDRIDHEFHCCAAGAAEGEATLHLPARPERLAISRASLNRFSAAYAETFSDVEARTVPVRPLDSFAEHRKGPFGLKIDTEGYELDVIRGATRLLRQTEFVIAEVSLRERFQDGYRFSELIAELGRQGFEPLDFLRPPRPGAADCDVLFAPYESRHFSVGA